MNSVMVNIAGQSVPCNADIRHNRAFDGMKVALRSAHHRRMVGKVGDEATNDFVAETIKKLLMRVTKRNLLKIYRVILIAFVMLLKQIVIILTSIWHSRFLKLSKKRRILSLAVLGQCYSLEE